MSTTHPPSSPPLRLDDDIHRKIDDILKTYVILPKDSDVKNRPKAIRRQPRTSSQTKRHCEQGRDSYEEEAYGGLLQSLTQAVQEERNGWKEKLHAALQELDRQHKENLTVQSHLQDLLNNLHVNHLKTKDKVTNTVNVKGKAKGNTEVKVMVKGWVKDEVEDADEVSVGSLEMVRRLHGCVQDLQDAAKGIQWDQDLQWSVECLQGSLARCQEEKEQQEVTIQQKMAEIHWLHKQLDNRQHHLQRLQDVILNYNTAHSTPFRLHHVQGPQQQQQQQKQQQQKQQKQQQQKNLSHPQNQCFRDGKGLNDGHQRDFVKGKLIFPPFLVAECLDQVQSESLLPPPPPPLPLPPLSSDPQPTQNVAGDDSDKTTNNQNHDSNNSPSGKPKPLQPEHPRNVTKEHSGDDDDDILETSPRQPVTFHTHDVTTSPKSFHNDADEKSAVIHARTYVEGDRTEGYVTPAEELTVWKQRVKHRLMDVRGRGKGGASAGVTQCLRCQKLFQAKENNPRACHYHHKGREIRELYDRRGRLTTVLYKWACCKKGLDIRGCAYGYHV